MPNMKAKASITLPTRSELHRHSLSIKFDDADIMIRNWQLFENGKARDSHPLTLKRMKS